MKVVQHCTNCTTQCTMFCVIFCSMFHLIFELMLYNIFNWIVQCLNKIVQPCTFKLLLINLDLIFLSDCTIWWQCFLNVVQGFVKGPGPAIRFTMKQTILYKLYNLIVQHCVKHCNWNTICTICTICTILFLTLYNLYLYSSCTNVVQCVKKPFVNLQVVQAFNYIVQYVVQLIQNLFWLIVQHLLKPFVQY